MRRAIIIIILLMFILLGGCIQEDSSSDKEWKVIDTWSGILYNGTVTTSVSYFDNFDGKIFNISRITADNQYHYIGYIEIKNTGTIFEDISIGFIGPIVLYNYKETKDELKQMLSSGERPSVDDISLKIFINENSTKNEDYISFSSAEHFYNFELGTTAPGESVFLYLYIKSYNETLSGEYKILTDIEIDAKASTGPIFNPTFELFNIEGNEFIFNLDFILVLSSDVSFGDIIISYPKCDVCQPVILPPISSQRSNYHIDINLKIDGNPSQYPFDKYQGVIELNAINELNTKYINTSLKNYRNSKTTADWRVTLYGENNQIFFSFERNHEREVFIVLLSINLFMISLGIFIILSKRKKWKWKNKKPLSNYFPSPSIFPWISLIFFGLNYIVFYSPTLFNLGNFVLLFLLIILFIIMAKGK